eukprot:COSAG06_NODE_2527_length_6720_cov_2.669687_3_plen_84_part_00
MLPGQGQGSAGASYTDTENAKHGDLGSKLPPLDTGVVWKAGAGVEVAWNLKAWHGGGYTCLLRPRYTSSCQIQTRWSPLLAPR